MAVSAFLLIHPAESPGQTWEQRADYGWSLIQHQRYDEALAVYEEILRANPGMARAHNGVACLQLGMQTGL